MKANFPFIFICLFIFASLSFGQSKNWEFITKDADGYDVYLEKDYLKATGNFPKVSIQNFDKDGYSINLVQLDCQKRKTLLLNSSKYTAKDLLLWRTVAKSSWYKVETSTPIEQILNTVCQISDKNASKKKSAVKRNTVESFAEIKVAKTQLNSLPNQEGEIIRELQFGERLKIIEIVKDEPWYKVYDAKTKRQGWIHFNAFSVVTSKTPHPQIVLLSLNPSTIYVGSKTFLLEVNGYNFTPNLSITFNGILLPTNFLSDKLLTAIIPEKLFAVEGEAKIRIISGTKIENSQFLVFTVEKSVTPNYDYVGLISRQGANSDIAYLQPRNSKNPPIGVRLNDTVGGKYRVIEISSREIVLKDIELGAEYKIPLYRITQNGGGKGGNNSNNSCPPGIPCNQPQIQKPSTMGCPPGIPCNPSQNMRQPQPNDKKEPDDEDDEDGDN